VRNVRFKHQKPGNFTSKSLISWHPAWPDPIAASPLGLRALPPGIAENGQPVITGSTGTFDHSPLAFFQYQKQLESRTGTGILSDHNNILRFCTSDPDFGAIDELLHDPEAMYPSPAIRAAILDDADQNGRSINWLHLNINGISHERILIAERLNGFYFKRIIPLWEDDAALEGVSRDHIKTYY
jgi:hypothetical protein